MGAVTKTDLQLIMKMQCPIQSTHLRISQLKLDPSMIHTLRMLSKNTMLRLILHLCCRSHRCYFFVQSYLVYWHWLLTREPNRQMKKKEELLMLEFKFFLFKVLTIKIFYSHYYYSDWSLSFPPIPTEILIFLFSNKEVAFGSMLDPCASSSRDSYSIKFKNLI